MVCFVLCFVVCVVCFVGSVRVIFSCAMEAMALRCTYASWLPTCVKVLVLLLLLLLLLVLRETTCGW